MSQIRVGILRGGAVENYNSSLKSGGDIILHILENLSDKYKPIDILIDKDYIWHLNGLPVNPGDLMSRVDLVWNTTHPSFSNILESLSIPTVGASAFAHTLEQSREMLREHMRGIGVEMPRIIVYPKSAREVFEKFGAPWIVKISNDMKIVKTFNELAEAMTDQDNVVVEEFIAGKVASVHSISNFRGENIYTFPFGNTFGNFSQPEKEKLINLAKQLHGYAGADHYLKSNFILTPRNKVYLLSIESMPDLKQNSHFAEACELSGIKMHHIVEHILEGAI